MGKISALVRQVYWLSRFLDTMPDPPAKSIRAEDLTAEQLASRYANRAYYLITGEIFNRKEFRKMMDPDLDKKKTTQ